MNIYDVVPFPVYNAVVVLPSRVVILSDANKASGIGEVILTRVRSSFTITNQQICLSSAFIHPSRYSLYTPLTRAQMHFCFCLYT